MREYLMSSASAFTGCVAIVVAFLVWTFYQKTEAAHRTKAALLSPWSHSIAWLSSSLERLARVYSKHLVRPFSLAGDQLSNVQLAGKHQTHTAGQWHSNQLGQGAVKAISVPLESVSIMDATDTLRTKNTNAVFSIALKKMYIRRLTSYSGIRSIIITFLISH